MDKPKHIYDVYIRATPERIWDAITKGEMTQVWFHGTIRSGELKPGSACQFLQPDGQSAVDGEVIEVDPPKRFVHTWKANWGPEFVNERPSRVTWELTPMGETTLLRLTHDDFDGETVTYKSISEGWAPLLSSLKSLLETGQPLTVAEAAS